MPQYCPTCNRSDSDAKFYGEFCEFCTRNKLQTKLPNKVEITRCKRCGKIRQAKIFVNPNGRNITEAIAKGMGWPVIVTGVGEKTAEIKVLEETNYGPIEIDRHIYLDYKKAICDTCYKRAGDYYEAVVQLRGNERKAEKFIAFVDPYFEQHGQFITKVMQVDNGMDVYLSDKNLAKQFIAYMRLRAKVSYTLQGVRNGKKIYKNTYAIHYT